MRLYAYLDSLLIHKRTEWLRLRSALFLRPRHIEPPELPIACQIWYVSFHSRPGFFDSSSWLFWFCCSHRIVGTCKRAKSLQRWQCPIRMALKWSSRRASTRATIWVTPVSLIRPVATTFSCPMAIRSAMLSNIPTCFRTSSLTER